MASLIANAAAAASRSSSSCLKVAGVQRLASVAQRQYGTATWPQDEPLPGVFPNQARDTKSFPDQPEFQVTTLPNGLRVATREQYGAVARVGLHVNYGARDEARGHEGLTHYLRRVLLQCSSGKASAFRLHREVDQVGGVLSSDAGREHMCFTASALREHTPLLVELLTGALAEPELFMWELKDMRPQFEEDILAAEASPQVRVLEGLHRAAFNGGLGNSLYLDPNGFLDAESTLIEALDGALSSHFVADNMALVGVNVDHAAVVKAAGGDAVRAAAGGAPKRSATAYVGGAQHRSLRLGAETHAAVAWAGPGLQGGADLAAARVLQQVLGTSGARVHWGDDHSKLAAVGGGNVALSSFVAPYTDAGLFGIYAVAGRDGDLAGALKGSVAALKKVAAGDVAEEEVARAAKAAARVLAEAVETSAGASSAQAARLLHGAGAGGDAAATKAAVAGLAKKLLGSKPTVSAHGNLRDVPYASEVCSW